MDELDLKRVSRNKKKVSLKFRYRLITHLLRNYGLTKIATHQSKKKKKKPVSYSKAHIHTDIVLM
jgi:hypothetical protein